MNTNSVNETPLACDMTAIAPGQQERHQINNQQLFAMVQERQELPGGYAFRFLPESELIGKIAQFISLERLCCPFFTFTVVIEPDGGPLWLKLTGRNGVKQFLLAELGLE